MRTSLSEVLLEIASAIAADGGASVRAALESVLGEAVPFDAGELVLVRNPGDTWRQPLGTAEGSVLGVLGKDLLEHVIAHGAAYRIDDWRDAEPFAETLGLLRARSLRSLLVVSFRKGGPGRPPLAGALAVGRSQGWAFVGASLPLLTSVAAMAALALDRALILTVLAERAGASGDASPGWPSAPAPEERLLEAERSRDEWAQNAALLRTRSLEQDAEIETLRRGMAGAREAAAAAADMAESGQARIRELEARLDAASSPGSRRWRSGRRPP